MLESITPDMFQGAVHRDIYEAMRRLADTGGRLMHPGDFIAPAAVNRRSGPSSGIAMAMKEGAEDAGRHSTMRRRSPSSQRSAN